MSLLKPTVALIAALALGGCDRFEEPAPAAPPVVAPPEASEPTMYVKGNSTVTIGATHDFRAQSVRGAVSYSWSALGSGTALIDTRGNARIVTVTGAQPGRAVVHATAYDASERVLATGRREIVVVQ